jgi:hypothetical protein
MYFTCVISISEAETKKEYEAMLEQKREQTHQLQQHYVDKLKSYGIDVHVSVKWLSVFLPVFFSKGVFLTPCTCTQKLFFFKSFKSSQKLHFSI